MGKLSIYRNLLLFHPYHIVKAIFNRLNLRLSQKSDPLDTFLNKFYSSIKYFLCVYLINIGHFLKMVYDSIRTKVHGH